MKLGKLHINENAPEAELEELPDPGPGAAAATTAPAAATAPAPSVVHPKYVENKYKGAGSEIEEKLGYLSAIFALQGKDPYPIINKIRKLVDTSYATREANIDSLSDWLKIAKKDETRAGKSHGRKILITVTEAVDNTIILKKYPELKAIIDIATKSDGPIQDSEELWRVVNNIGRKYGIHRLSRDVQNRLQRALSKTEIEQPSKTDEPDDKKMQAQTAEPDERNIETGEMQAQTAEPQTQNNETKRYSRIAHNRDKSRRMGGNQLAVPSSMYSGENLDFDPVRPEERYSSPDELNKLLARIEAGEPNIHVDGNTAIKIKAEWDEAHPGEELSMLPAKPSRSMGNIINPKATSMAEMIDIALFGNIVNEAKASDIMRSLKISDNDIKGLMGEFGISDEDHKLSELKKYAGGIMARAGRAAAKIGGSAARAAIKGVRGAYNKYKDGELEEIDPREAADELERDFYGKGKHQQPHGNVGPGIGIAGPKSNEFFKQLNTKKNIEYAGKIISIIGDIIDGYKNRALKSQKNNKWFRTGKLFDEINREELTRGTY